MKKNLKHWNIILLFLAVPFLFTTSCKKKDNPEAAAPATLLPSITSLSPNSATAETEITIAGENFGDNANVAKVTFGSKTAVIVSYSKQQIKVKAPAGAGTGKVNVFVSVGSLNSNKLEFEYIGGPSIAGLSSTCFYNSTVVITGSGFSTDKAANMVKFGTVPATVIEATNTTLRVKTPDLGSATTASVTVTSADVTSNAWIIAVDVDQNKVATYNWTTHTVKPGVIYRSGQYTLFGGSQRLYVLDVTLDASNTLGIGFSTTNATTTTMCTNYNAVAGVNAGYFPFNGSSDKDPYIRINGATVQSGHLGVPLIFTNSALIITNNTASVRKFTETHTNLNLVAAAIPVSQAENIMVCGPILLVDDVIQSQNTSSHNTSLTARTGVGVTADGKRVFMVVADTGGGFTGVTTPQLAKILQALGADDAMNMDGGGSSTMFVKDQGENGRVNFPNGGTFQRAVRSVIYVK
ncbi:MAG TPA: phosphodiester glycosidase family protein [Sphingobacteriaceae bacterium]